MLADNPDARILDVEHELIEDSDPVVEEESIQAGKHNEPEVEYPLKPVQPAGVISESNIDHADDILNWSETAFELELDAIARQIVLNSVVKSYADKVLQLGFLPELEVMLKPEVEKQIKQAVEQQLGVSLKLEFISMPVLDVETPHQAGIRKLEQERQAVIQKIHQDEVVLQLKSVFGAELIEHSVRKRNSKSE